MNTIKKIILYMVIVYFSTMPVISQNDIIFTGNITTIWNASIPGQTYVTSDLDGDDLDDILIRTGYKIQIRKGLNNVMLWEKNIDPQCQAFPIEDLNGDGLYDIIEECNTQIRAMKGTDGTDLWQEGITDGYIQEQLAGDLDGDGLNDILLHIQSPDTNLDMLKAKKGTDGTDLWQESTTMTMAISGSPIGDINNDGLNDILVHMGHDIGSTGVLKVKKGIDGIDLWQENIVNGQIYGQPIGDINNDGLNDILTLSYNFDTRFTTNILKVKNGADGTDLWQYTINGNSFIVESNDVVNDLNGDGIEDILLSIYDTEAGICCFSTLKAKKGSDGTDLWQETGSRYEHIRERVYGDTDGDGLNDVFLSKFDTPKATIKAKRGIDGIDLWEESVNNVYPIGYNEGRTDLDGDGLNDILLDIQYYDSSIADLQKIKKGIDGTILWQENAPSGHTSGDLDGDGLKDILIDMPYTIKAKKGINGADIWKATSSSGIRPILKVYKQPYVYSVGPDIYTYDLNGDGYNDILLRSMNNLYLVTTVNYKFTGFFQPIDNLPTWNSVKAGSAIPAKFSLDGYKGLDIFATDYPASQRVDCISSVLIDAIEDTVTAGANSILYDATTDQYNYIWKTDKAWKNSCRQLTILLKDGTYHNASFNLK